MAISAAFAGAAGLAVLLETPELGKWRGMSFTGMTVLLVAVAIVWASTAGQRPSGAPAATEVTADYQSGDGALRALLD